MEGALDLGRVELLEAIELLWFRAFAERGESGELYEAFIALAPFGGWPAHVKVLELIGVQAGTAHGLGDDAITPTLDTKAVHVVTAEQGCKIAADALKIEAERGDFIAIEDN